MNVTQKNITESVKALGIQNGDIVLVHSSLKSMGYVEGGALAVIDGFRAALQPDGTLVMPTLCQKNFEHVFEDWHPDRPSDVGLITETFRKLQGAFRSDQETHSVAAMGPRALEITGSHKSYGPRYGVYGDYAFSYSSPWQKMYDMNGKIVLLGVSMRKNTFKHFVEYRLVENLLKNVDSNAKRSELKSKVMYHTKENGRDVMRGSIWPFFDCMKMQEALEENKMIKKSVCKNATLLCMNIKETCDFAYDLLQKDFSVWYEGEVLEWLEKCLKNSSSHF